MKMTSVLHKMFSSIVLFLLILQVVCEMQWNHSHNYLATKWTHSLSVHSCMSLYQIRYSLWGLTFGGMTITSYFKLISSSLPMSVVHGGGDWNWDYCYKLSQQILKESSLRAQKATATVKAMKIHSFHWWAACQLRKVSKSESTVVLSM